MYLIGVTKQVEESVFPEARGVTPDIDTKQAKKICFQNRLSRYVIKSTPHPKVGTKKTSQEICEANKLTYHFHIMWISYAYHIHIISISYPYPYYIHIISISYPYHIHSISVKHIHHSFGTIEHFLARNDMILRWVGSTINLLLIQIIKTKLYMVQTGTYKQNLEFSACFGTIKHFLARMNMILRRVRSAINFLSDFISF